MTNATAQKHVSKLIKVLYKLTLQSVYGAKIAQNGTRNSTKQSPSPSDYGCRPIKITSRLRPAAPVMDATTG